MHDKLTIGEVARQAGIRPSAVRYYESSGLLPAPQRVNGHRRYDPDVLQRLAFIQLAKQAGFTVGEIQTLLHISAPETALSARWQALAQQKLLEVDALILRAETMKRLLKEGLNCGCLQLDECVFVENQGCVTEAQTTYV